jgi:hypothetical protein
MQRSGHIRFDRSGVRTSEPSYRSIDHNFAFTQFHILLIKRGRRALRRTRGLMKCKDAKPLIIEAWDSWLRKQAIDFAGPTGRDSLKFFIELEDTRSHLLEFDPKGRDKWLLIHSWLQRTSRVAELPLALYRARHRPRRNEARPSGNSRRILRDRSAQA